MGDYGRVAGAVTKAVSVWVNFTDPRLTAVYDAVSRGQFDAPLLPFTYTL